MATTALHYPSESSVTDAYWTLLSSLSLKVRRALALRLEASIAQETQNREKEEKKGIAEALSFIDSLSIKGGQPVPTDEKGIDALIDYKYI